MSEQATIDREADIRAEVNTKWSATAPATKELTRAFIAADGKNGTNAEVDWDDLEMMQGLAESIDAFNEGEKRLPRCMAEVNAWMNSADDFKAYVLANPLAVQAPSEASKIDAAKAALEAEQAKAAAEAAFKAAEEIVKTSATNSAKRAGALIAAGRGQLAELGAIFAEHFTVATRGGLIPWENARNMLTAALALETGETLDVGRPMQVNAAADFFGRASFIALPKDTQRAFGALFSLVDCLDDGGKATGAKRYDLTGLANNDAIRACSFARGENRKDIASFLPSARFASGGYMHQEDVRQLLAIIQRAAFSADKAKATDDVTKNPSSLANVARAAVAEREQSKLDRSKHRDKIKRLLEAEKNGEALPTSEASQSPAPAGEAKPHGNAVSINEALKDTNVKLAFARTVEKEVLADVIAAFGEAGRLADMQYLHKILAREILLARHIAENGGPGKCTRKQAREAIRANEETKRAAKVA